jgi:hypothetical protein
MKKNYCYVFWDNDVAQSEQMIYTQCEECHSKNKKGIRWSSFYGNCEVKCNLCNTIIYKSVKKKKVKKGDNEGTI